jgi:hypothetical protein
MKQKQTLQNEQQITETVIGRRSGATEHGRWKGKISYSVAVALLLASTTDQRVGSASVPEAQLRGNTGIVTNVSLSRATACGATNTLVAKDPKL